MNHRGIRIVWRCLHVRTRNLHVHVMYKNMCVPFDYFGFLNLYVYSSALVVDGVQYLTLLGAPPRCRLRILFSFFIHFCVLCREIYFSSRFCCAIIFSSPRSLLYQTFSKRALSTHSGFCQSIQQQQQQQEIKHSNNNKTAIVI